MSQGIIVKGIGGFYTVDTKDGEYTCKPRGVFRKKAIKPLVGDIVEISIENEEDKLGTIEGFETRKNEFVRPPVANIEKLGIVISPVNPSPDFMLVDKLLITSERNNIKPIIIINKVDLIEEAQRSELIDMMKNTGYKIIFMSKLTKEGYSELLDELKNSFTAFAGQSGVGKSTILNNIVENNVMETGEISAKISRGKHTTRHAQIIKLNFGGYVVDTPGFSSFELDNIAHDELMNFFPEIMKFNVGCRFNGCSHINEPDCRVKDAVKDNEISNERYENYVELYKLLKQSYNNRYR